MNAERLPPSWLFPPVQPQGPRTAVTDRAATLYLYVNPAWSQATGLPAS
ncbi:hypothetical protein [Streptomyces sp. YKOK-I1]